jgi:molecular chaperone GrpE
MQSKAEDKMDNNRPLRQSSDKKRDIYNTYMKNQEQENKSNVEEAVFEDLEEKVGAAMSEENLEEDEIRIQLEDSPEHDEEANEEIHTLEDSITILKKENDQLKDQLARRVAEMENMRRRTEKEKSELVQFANQRLLSNLLEIPDNIKQALQAAETAKDIDAVLKGIELINSKTFKLFEEAGVTIMEVNKGDEFDVDKHEALMHTASPDVEEGHIIQVVQDGYLYKERILRHAKVITSSGAE